MDPKRARFVEQVIYCFVINELAGDELLSDSFPYKEIQNGMLWEVEGKVRKLYLFNMHLLSS